MIAHVKTKGRTIAVNPNLMLLLDRGDGSAIVTATRAGGVWTLHAEGIDDATASTRSDAIDGMTRHAQQALGAENYTTQMQPGLDDQP